MRENGLRNEEIIRIIIIREYERYFRSNVHYLSSSKIRPGKNSGLCREPMTSYDTGAALDQPSQLGPGHYDGSKLPGCLGW